MRSAKKSARATVCGKNYYICMRRTTAHGNKTEEVE